MSRNEVPPPPNPFTVTVHTTLLPKGTELHRIYSRDYPGNAFNPSYHFVIEDKASGAIMGSVSLINYFKFHR